MSVKNVFLDLDNTLISAEPIEDFPFGRKNIKRKALQFSIHNMDGYYIVFERPGLQEFLDNLFANYNVSVWTAASKDYALFIIDKIILTKPNRQLDYVFFSYHGDLSKKMYRNPKDLRLLWEVFKLRDYTADNTIIIDDYIDVVKNQRNNSIQIHPFEILDEGSERDVVLKDIIPEIQNKL